MRERTREAALAAARRVDPQIRQAILGAMQRNDPRVVVTPAPEPSEIYPTKLRLTFIYIPGAANRRSIHVWYENSDLGPGTH